MDAVRALVFGKKKYQIERLGMNQDYFSVILVLDHVTQADPELHAKLSILFKAATRYNRSRDRDEFDEVAFNRAAAEELEACDPDPLADKSILFVSPMMHSSCLPPEILKHFGEVCIIGDTFTEKSVNNPETGKIHQVETILSQHSGKPAQYIEGYLNPEAIHGVLKDKKFDYVVTGNVVNGLANRDEIGALGKLLLSSAPTLLDKAPTAATNAKQFMDSCRQVTKTGGIQIHMIGYDFTLLAGNKSIPQDFLESLGLSTLLHSESSIILENTGVLIQPTEQAPAEPKPSGQTSWSNHIKGTWVGLRDGKGGARTPK